MPTSRKGESTTTTMRADSLLARCCPPFNSCPWPCVMFPFFFKPSPIFWDRRWEWAWVVARLYVYESFFLLFFLFTRVCKRIKRDNPAMQCCLMGGKKIIKSFDQHYYTTSQRCRYQNILYYFLFVFVPSDTVHPLNMSCVQQCARTKTGKKGLDWVGQLGTKTRNSTQTPHLPPCSFLS